MRLSSPFVLDRSVVRVGRVRQPSNLRPPSTLDRGCVSAAATRPVRPRASEPKAGKDQLPDSSPRAVEPRRAALVPRRATRRRRRLHVYLDAHPLGMSELQSCRRPACADRAHPEMAPGPRASARLDPERHRDARRYCGCMRSKRSTGRPRVGGRSRRRATRDEPGETCSGRRVRRNRRGGGRISGRHRQPEDVAATERFPRCRSRTTHACPRGGRGGRSTAIIEIGNTTFAHGATLCSAGRRAA